MSKKIFLSKDESTFVKYKNQKINKISIKKTTKHLLFSCFMYGDKKESEEILKLIDLINNRSSKNYIHYNKYNLNINDYISHVLNITDTSLNDNDYLNGYLINQKFTNNVKVISFDNNDYFYNFFLNNAQLKIENCSNKLKEFNLLQKTNNYNESQFFEKMFLKESAKNNNKSGPFNSNSFFNDDIFSNKSKKTNIDDIEYLTSYYPKYDFLFNNTELLLEGDRKVPFIENIEKLNDKDLLVQSKLTNKAYEKYLNYFNTLLNFAQNNDKYHKQSLGLVFNNKEYEPLIIKKQVYVNEIKNIINIITKNIDLLSEYDKKVDYQNFKPTDLTDYLIKKSENVYLDQNDLFYVIAKDKYNSKAKDGIISLRSSGDKFGVFITHDFKNAVPLNNSMYELLLKNNYNYTIKGKIFVQNKVSSVAYEKDQTSDLLDKVSSKIEYHDLSVLTKDLTKEIDDKPVIKRSNKI